MGINLFYFMRLQSSNGTQATLLGWRGRLLTLRTRSLGVHLGTCAFYRVMKHNKRAETTLVGGKIRKGLGFSKSGGYNGWKRLFRDA